MERIIANLEKAKLKLDEAFFYLDEIEELIEEGEFDDDTSARVGQANERLVSELAGLSSKVADLQNILRMLDQQSDTTSEA
jgi:hypothetical protein